MSHVKPGKWRKNNLSSAKGTSPVVRETGNGQAASSPHIKYTENSQWGAGASLASFSTV